MCLTGISSIQHTWQTLDALKKGEGPGLSRVVIPPPLPRHPLQGSNPRHRPPLDTSSNTIGKHLDAHKKMKGSGLGRVVIPPPPPPPPPRRPLQGSNPRHRPLLDTSSNTTGKHLEAHQKMKGSGLGRVVIPSPPPPPPPPPRPLQGSNPRHRPLLDTSSNTMGKHPDALEKIEEGSGLGRVTIPPPPPPPRRPLQGSNSRHGPLLDTSSNTIGKHLDAFTKIGRSGLGRVVIPSPPPPPPPLPLRPLQGSNPRQRPPLYTSFNTIGKHLDALKKIEEGSGLGRVVIPPPPPPPPPRPPQGFHYGRGLPLDTSSNTIRKHLDALKKKEEGSGLGRVVIPPAPPLPPLRPLQGFHSGRGLPLDSSSNTIRTHLDALKKIEEGSGLGRVVIPPPPPPPPRRPLQLSIAQHQLRSPLYASSNTLAKALDAFKKIEGSGLSRVVIIPPPPPRPLQLSIAQHQPRPPLYMYTLRKPLDDLKKVEEESAPKRHDKTGEGRSVTKSPPWDSVLIQGGDLVVFNCHKEQLVHLLLEDDSRTKDVLVTGRAGSGLTALVRKVWVDIRVRKHFGTIAWISVPPMNDLDLIRHDIFLQLLFENKVPVPDDLSALAVNDQMLEHQIISLLQKERCLIVVDNLVDQSTLVTFQNASHLVQTGRVIFIARHEMVPRNWNMHWDEDELVIHKLGDLSEEESWALFHSKTFPEGDVPSPLKEGCRDIVRKCEGLPEAIDLFSRLLRNKKERNDEWPSMITSFDHELDLIQQVLKIIYQDDRLGSCLLYLSIFPESSLISRMRVSRLWTAEGFLNLERADDFLQELLYKKWIHPVETRSDGGLSTFQMDNLVREIIVSFSDHLNLLRITSEGSTNWPERVRYLSVQETLKDLNEEKLSQLRSLFMFNVSSNKDQTTMSEASPSGTSKNQLFPLSVKLLKVLDLTGAPLPIDPDALFESTLLRYLSLRDTSIEVIPGSIGRLTHLEFLVLKHSFVTELPKEVEGLQRIRHILIYHHEKDPLMESYHLIGFKALCSFRWLKSLEKLCFVESNDSILKDLVNLTKLRRLGITKLRKVHGELLCTALRELKELRSLNLHAFDEDEILDLDHPSSSSPVSLKRLYLHGRLDKLPNWISSLCHLTKIVLRWSHLEGATQQDLATLGKLLNLVELELRQAYDGKQLDFKNGQFSKLKILLLDELGRLRSMSLEKGTMPCLKDLTISRCPWLERIPTGIEHVTALQALEFYDMSPEFYQKVPDDYRNSKGKLQVYFTQWRPGQWKTIPL